MLSRPLQRRGEDREVVEELTRGASRMRAGGVAPESRPPSRLLQALQLLTPFACPWYFGALHAQRDFGDDAAFSQEAVSNEKSN